MGSTLVSAMNKRQKRRLISFRFIRFVLCKDSSFLEKTFGLKVIKCILANEMWQSVVEYDAEERLIPMEWHAEGRVRMY